MAGDNRQSNLTGRMLRYARVGGAVGGTAARFAGSRLFGIELDRDRHAAELTRALGGLKGPLMKVAQLLATIPDALPAEYAAELQQLQSDAPSMGWPFVRRRMATELGPDWRARFAEFDREAAHAASLGQVHRAIGLDGRDLACKLQYPDMASAVEADLTQLRVIFSLYERYDKAISTKQIHRELSERLREELDYAREARHIRLYRAMLADETGVQAPEPVAELSTDRLLTMTWMDGHPLVGFEDSPVEFRNRIAHNMFRAWYVPFY
jgi:predicted unusual protein kinase regulating ubiquinone biosynthesis (AarF/ABC1/UbiB family)